MVLCRVALHLHHKEVVQILAPDCSKTFSASLVTRSRYTLQPYWNVSPIAKIWTLTRRGGLNSRDLAKMLKLYEIQSTKVTVGGISLQGYRRDDLHDKGWLRYLPSYSAQVELPELEEQIPEVPQVPPIRNTKSATPLTPYTEKYGKTLKEIEALFSAEDLEQIAEGTMGEQAISHYVGLALSG